MLLRSALGMGIVMVLMGLAQNIWQFLILRALLGLLGGFVPTLMLLSPHKYRVIKAAGRWGTLSTGGVSGALLGPMAGGLLADSYGFTSGILYYRQCAHTLLFRHPVLHQRKIPAGQQKRDAAHAGSGDIT
ncbi:Multidrug resistance protein MdtG [Escherichia coli]|uniref:Multidrug resistance protein MdtG n=1 Tax=Escherichia coli TaxID=562 RepID=A0A376KW68_ECOLX|nr:Multidrug resistance protein MdtG [Escherichia coli]